MKKFFAAAALSLAALFLFTGCAAQVTVSISSGWFTNPANGYEPSFYESLDYSISFIASDSGSNATIEIDGTNSAYNITTQAEETYTVPGTSRSYTDVYHLTITAKVSATYTYTRENGEVLSYTFGGAEDTGFDGEFAPEDADASVVDVWFTSPQSQASGTDQTPPAFSPLYSERKTRSHWLRRSVSNDSDVFISLYDYTVKITYDERCENATIAYADAFADLTNEERAANDYVVKDTTLFPESYELGNLQKNYTCVDNAQLFFITRGLAMSTDTTHTLTVVDGSACNYPAALRISCRELVTEPLGFNFTIVDENGGETEHRAEEDFSMARMQFSVANNGTNVGEPPTVTYAQRPAEGSNTYRCLPLSIDQPHGYSIGSYVYTLTRASYQAPAAQA